MSKMILDLEANGLKPDKIWVISLSILDDTNKVIHKESLYGERLTKSNLDRLVKDYSVTTYIGHNILGYDYRVLRNLLSFGIDLSEIYDTLVVSRLLHCLQGKHSIEYYGEVFNIPKKPDLDWSKWDVGMIDRCEVDRDITCKLYIEQQKELNKLPKKGFYVRIEHHVQDLLEDMKEHGFYLDTNKATKVLSELTNITTEFESDIHKIFKPIPEHTDIIEPRYKKDGSISKVGLRSLTDHGVKLKDVGGPFSPVNFIPFNLNSPSQVVARLKKLGWKPTIPTKTGKSWKICPENLETIPKGAPEELKKFKTYLMAESRRRVVKGWLDMVDTDSRLRSNVISVGAVTHRMAHQGFQQANIPSVELDNDDYPIKGEAGGWGWDLRDCLGVSDDSRRLVGADAAGIQLRVLSHHMKDPEWQEVLLSGDIHSYHAEKAGGITRPQAKTFIYAWLLGAQKRKVGQIIGGTPQDGQDLMDRFLEAFPALDRVKHEANMCADRGYFVALDGRRIPVQSRHLALSVYLQGDEQAIMKQAALFLRKRLLTY